jgi:hypothetical protein
MKCENCAAYNAHVIKINMDQDTYILCPRCLKILQQLENEFESIVEADELTSSRHINKNSS